LTAKSELGSTILARSLPERGRGEAGAARFESAFLRHHGRVHGLLRRLLGSDEAAEDAAQEVFLRLYRQDAPPADDEGLGRWLTRVATNVGLNILRSDRRRSHPENPVTSATRLISAVKPIPTNTSHSRRRL
jgi:DNA-directed RNA polymerase specialized sigma24 family protein